MKKYCRVFLKGEPMRWFDFPMADDAADLFAFMAQTRFEGFASSAKGFIAYDEIRAAMFIETADGPEQTVDYTKARMQ